jgi:hypothetical protein
MQLADPLLAQGGQSNVAAKPPVTQEESNERGKEVEGSGAGDKVRATEEEREASQLSSIAYDNYNEVKDTGGKS